MALTFPANPTNGQIYDQYVYDATAQSWRVYGSDTGITNVLATKANLSGGNTFTGNQVFSNFISNPNRPAFSARANSGSIAATQTFPYNVAPLNVGGHYNTSTYRFTAPVAGTYFFATFVHIDGGSNNQISFRVNNTDIMELKIQYSASAIYASLAGSFAIYLNANDNVRVWHAAGTLTGTAEPFSSFSGFLVG
jgi:hypothetical protein